MFIVVLEFYLFCNVEEKYRFASAIRYKERPIILSGKIRFSRSFFLLFLAFPFTLPCMQFLIISDKFVFVVVLIPVHTDYMGRNLYTLPIPITQDCKVN